METESRTKKLAPVPENLNIVLEFTVNQKWDIRRALLMAPELVDDAFNQVWFTENQLEYVQTVLASLFKPGNSEDFRATRRAGYIGVIGVYLADKTQPEDQVRFAWMPLDEEADEENGDG